MSGIFGTYGFKTETSVGAAITVDTFIPILSAGFQVEQELLQSQGLQGRNFAGCIKPGRRTISGSFSTELFGVGIAEMLYHMFGEVSSTGTGPTYVHTYTAGNLNNLSFTAEEAMPNNSGDTHGFKYAGCKYTDWEMSANVGQFVQVSGNISAQTVTVGAAPAVASYAESCPFSFIEAAVSFDGSPLVEAESFSLSLNNALRTDSHRLGSPNIRNQSHNAFRTVTGEIEVEFTDLDITNAFLDSDDVAIVITLDNGSDSLVVTMPTVKLSGSLPELNGPDVVRQTIGFMAYNETDDADVISAVLTNTEDSAS
jgi:hypothetical protein